MSGKSPSAEDHVNLMANYYGSMLPSQSPSSDTLKASDEFARLSIQIKKLERESRELGEIRATLLVNFGDTEHNCYGFKVKNEKTTIRLMMEVLEQLTKGAKAEAERPFEFGDVVQMVSGGLRYIQAIEPFGGDPETAPEKVERWKREGYTVTRIGRLPGKDHPATSEVAKPLTLSEAIAQACRPKESLTQVERTADGKCIDCGDRMELIGGRCIDCQPETDASTPATKD